MEISLLFSAHEGQKTFGYVSPSQKFTAVLFFSLQGVPDEVWPWPRYELSPYQQRAAWAGGQPKAGGNRHPAVSPQLKTHFGNTVKSVLYFLCASVYLPVREGIYLLPWRITMCKEYRDHALATFKPLLSLLSDEHFCLLFSPWALHIFLATTFALKFLCQLNIKREEVAMAST